VIRLVVDPGVFISALIGPPGSPPDQIVQAWIDDRVELIASPALLAELRRVIARPKFRRWFDELTARQLAERIERHATFLPDVTIPPTARDRDDDYLVALGRAAEATAIVSGDRDLREAGIASPPVWTPRVCAKHIGRESQC
jgi:putative PIN family toxin of toxin-antitoxin system